MYREFKVKDAEGKLIKFQVYPDLAQPHANLIKPIKYEIELTLPTQVFLSEMIAVVNKFMGGNTIDYLEIKEVEEE